MPLHAGEKLLERYGMTETGMLLGNPYRCVPLSLRLLVHKGHKSTERQGVGSAPNASSPSHDAS